MSSRAEKLRRLLEQEEASAKLRDVKAAYQAGDVDYETYRQAKLDHREVRRDFRVNHRQPSEKGGTASPKTIATKVKANKVG